MSQEQVNTLIGQMKDVIAFTDAQKDKNKVYDTVQGQVGQLLPKVDKLEAAHPPGAHAGGAIEEIAESLKLVPK